MHHTEKIEQTIEIFCDESLWVEVKVKTELFLIGFFYSPSTADAQFFNSFNLNIEKANTQKIW